MTGRTVIVGGLGHVGLPFGLFLASRGFDVWLHDVNEAHKRAVLAGEMPFMEVGASNVLRDALSRETLHVADDLSAIEAAEHIVIAIGTPLDQEGRPDATGLMSLVADMAPLVQYGQHLMLRSTVTLGTTTRLHEKLKDMSKCLDISFCPERIVQGNALLELPHMPQIVSGTTAQAEERAARFFNALGVEVVRLSPEGAELAKLFCNAWRYIQFAASNEFCRLAEFANLNYETIRSAITHSYPRATIPKAGFAAGPCLHKDTVQLAASFPAQFGLGEAALEINEQVPRRLVEKVLRRGLDLRGKTAAILGMAFKADIDDTRDSLSFRLRDCLRDVGARVLCSDEYVRTGDLVDRDVALAQADVVFVAVPHSAYFGMRFPGSSIVVDPWEVTVGGTRP